MRGWVELVGLAIIYSPEPVASNHLPFTGGRIATLSGLGCSVAVNARGRPALALSDNNIIQCENESGLLESLILRAQDMPKKEERES